MVSRTGFVIAESQEPGHGASATHIVCSEGGATERFPLLEPVPESRIPNPESQMPESLELFAGEFTVALEPF
jgi:hypothetical protein